MARAEVMGEGLFGAPSGGAAAVEASSLCVQGVWRPAGVLDRLRLRSSSVVARARVRCVDALRVGSLIVVAAQAEGVAVDLWVRVMACTPSAAGSYDAVLDLLGEPAAEAMVRAYEV